MKPVVNGNNNGVPWHSCQFSTLPEIYVQNASLEIACVSNVTEKKSISGDKIIPFISKGLEGFDLNHPYDWEYALYLLKQNIVLLPRIHTTAYRKKMKD